MRYCPEGMSSGFFSALTSFVFSTIFLKKIAHPFNMPDIQKTAQSNPEVSHMSPPHSVLELLITMLSQLYPYMTKTDYSSIICQNSKSDDPALFHINIRLKGCWWTAWLIRIEGLSRQWQVGGVMGSFLPVKGVILLGGT